jgi:ABC-2 type transport system permease protein
VRGLMSFIRKEATEIVRTWRIWVLPGMIVFFAISGPILAKYMPELLKSLGGATGGIQIIIPRPSWADSYTGQWIKNLSQVLLFTLIIIYGGLVSSERKSGTAILVLTKPVSRTAFVIAKFLTHACFVVLTVCGGALLTWGVTALVFPDAPLAPLAAGTGAWLAYGVMIIGLMTLLSVAISSQAGAAGLGFAIYALSAVLGIWKAAALYSPIGLMGLPTELAAGKHPAVLWPVSSALVLTVVFVAAAALLFRRQEL